jgi:predicted nucleic acid-binding protein
MRIDSRIFLDINVVIDFLEQSRKRHYVTIELIEHLVANNYDICISEDMLTTIYYISKEKRLVLKFLKTVTRQWNILYFGKEIISEAIETALENDLDLEDLLQCICARVCGCNTLITQDKTFYDCGMTIRTAEEFLKEKRLKS